MFTMKTNFILYLLIAGSLPCFGQTADTLLLINGNILIGEIKSMNRGVLLMETPYSDSDFKIEWEKISNIKSTTTFLITISNGERYNSVLRTTEEGSISIFSENGIFRKLHNDIVYLNSIDPGF